MKSSSDGQCREAAALVRARRPLHRWSSSSSTRLRRVLAAVAALTVLLTSLQTLLHAALRVRHLGTALDGQEPGAPSHGAVVSQSALCSRHGADMLTMGGNAADAMVATSFCVGVVGMWLYPARDSERLKLTMDTKKAMYHSGIGGGGFALIRDASASIEFLDFRETAPALSDVDMFARPDASSRPGLKCGVPGELRGLHHIHQKYGSLPWSTVLRPAIKLARHGFPVTRDFLRYTGYAVDEAGHDFLRTDPTWSVDFAPNGTRLRLGDTITRTRYADTLEQIARHGPDAFYAGRLGRQFVDAVRAHGGVMTTDDLAGYRVRVRGYSETEYRGYRVVTPTAPSSGIVVANILKVLNTYHDFFTDKNVNLSTHRLDEAIRFAYGLLGDPDYVDGMREYQDYMLHPSTVDSIRRRILDTQTQNVSAYNPDGLESIDTPGTSHFATVDSSGLAITATTSINRLFGNRVMSPENGIILNNELEDFSTPNTSRSFGYIPSRANYPQPGKRPFSSMTPCVVLRADGTLFMLAGAAGGSYITTATLQTIISAVDRALPASALLARPRLHDQLVPNRVTLETSYDGATADFLRRLGHEVAWIEPVASMAHAILVSAEGDFDAASEPRQVDSGSVVV